MAMVSGDFLGDMALDRGRENVGPGGATEALDTIYRIPLPTGHKASGKAQVIDWPPAVFRAPAAGGGNIEFPAAWDGLK